MRIQSKKKDVFFEPWQTPIMSEAHVGFGGSIDTGWFVHFCFEVFQKRDIFVVTIPSGSPYRVFEEAHLAFLDKYFDTDPSGEAFSLLKPRICQTWKLWNTDYINEMDEGYCISGYENEHKKEVVQYLIKTQSEWVEFIHPSPEWKVFKDTSFEKIIKFYLREDRAKAKKILNGDIK